MGRNLPSFKLAPRLNAPGRISNPKQALEVLCTSDPGDSRRLARSLEAQNEQRRDLTRKVERDVLEQISGMGDLRERGGFVLAGSDWDEGVLGIAASRVVEEYGRPAVLMTLAGDVAKGSGRSVRGVHLKEQLDYCKDYLARYGGHAQAVGFSIDKSRVDGFTEALTEQLKTATESLPDRPTLRIDADIGLNECTIELLDFLSVCEPFGYGNRTPVWMIRDVTVKPDTRIVGDGHLKLHIGDRDGQAADAISFNWKQRSVTPEELHGLKIDAAVTVKRGYFREKYHPDIHVLDVRESRG